MASSAVPYRSIVQELRTSLNTYVRRNPGRALAGLLVSLMIALGTLAALPQPASASGWGTLRTQTVDRALSSTSWTNLGSSFSTSANIRYRYCVRIKGTGTANLQPQAFGTSVTVNSTSYVTRCTISHSGSANTFQAAASRIGSGSLRIYSISWQRWYDGNVPV
jgi:hypothetical protein